VGERVSRLVLLCLVACCGAGACVKKAPEPPFVHLIGRTFDGCWVDVDGTTDVLIDADRIETVPTPKEGFSADWCVKQVERARVTRARIEAERLERLAEEIETKVDQIYRLPTDSDLSLHPDGDLNTGCYHSRPDRVAVAIEGEKVGEFPAPDGGVTEAWCREQVRRARASLDVAKWSDGPGPTAPKPRVRSQVMQNSPGGRQVIGDSP
jgi:hypothetical protein